METLVSLMGSGGWDSNHAQWLVDAQGGFRVCAPYLVWTQWSVEDSQEGAGPSVTSTEDHSDSCFRRR